MTTRIGIDARKADDYGIGTYVRGLLAGLAEVLASGAQPASERFVLFKPSGTDLGDLGEAFETREENAAGYTASELTALSRHAARERLDLFHAPHYVLPVALRCPAVVTIHDVLHLRFPDNLKHPAAIVYADRMLRRALDAEGVIAVSRTTRDDLASAYQVATSGIEVIPNGVDRRFFDSLSRERIDAALASLHVSRPYALFVGNPKPHKNLGVLLEAFRRWCDLSNVPASMRIVLAGGQKGLEVLRAQVREAGLGNRADVLGHVADDALPALYQGAELLLFPSLYEGFGLPVLEAMASGTPVLASDTPAVREVAGPAAVYAPASDPAAWAANLRQLLADPERRALLRSAGRRRATQFSWRRCAERTLEVYRRVARESAKANPGGGGSGTPPEGVERVSRPRRENDGGGFAWGAQLTRRGPK